MKKLVVLIMLIGTFYNCSKDEVDPAKEYMPIQLTSFNMDYNASLSPDGKNIVFYSLRYTYNPDVAAVLFELWAMDRYGENLRRLFKREEMGQGFEIRFIKWSSKSDYITVLLTSPFAQNSKSEIWKVALTGDKTKLYSFDFGMEKLSYSPDGTKTAFIIQGTVSPNGSPLYSLYSANANFSDTTLIEKGLIGDYDWTKDSKMLVYSFYDRSKENFDLWKTKLDGTGKIRFSETTESEEYFQCSKTDNLITYSVNNNVYITPTDNFSPTIIMENTRSSQWIPKRKLISLYSEQSTGDNWWTESWIVDLNGKVIRKIAEGEPSQVSFSVNGDYFVYSASGNIWLDYLPR